MKTKGNFKEKQQQFFGTFSTISKNDTPRYDNFNLNNQNQKCSKIEFLQSSKNISTENNNRQKQNNFDSSDFFQSKSYKHFSSSKPLNLLNQFDKKIEKQQWKKNDTSFSNATKSNNNNSTLSLHISAYENSIIASQKDESKKQITDKKAWKNLQSFNSVTQSSFEYPRQQENTKNEPEIMQFKASQYLLNPNNQEMASSEENIDEQKEIASIKDTLRLARDSVKRFEANVSIQTLKVATNICSEGIKQVGNALLENLDAFGLLNIIAEIIHRILHISKLQENISKLGPNAVAAAVDRFIALIETMMIKVGSFDVTQTWIQCYSLENLSIAFSLSSCVPRKKLTSTAIQAHSKLYLFKGDLLRYRCNIMNDPYGAPTKAYWTAFSLLPDQGIVFNLLGVIAASRDINDRLSQTFYFLRAISNTAPFEDSKKVLLAKLKQISQKMIKNDFVQHYEIFKDPSVTDINGINASTANSLRSDEYYFAWMPSVTAAAAADSKNTPLPEGEKLQQPKWKRRLSKFSRSAVFKIATDNLFHMIYLLITKESHSTLFATSERFLALISYILEMDEISGKELLQITTIFILSLKSRDSNDETFEMLSRTFLHYIGLLFSKLYQIMSHRKSDPNFSLEQKGMIILPSLVILDSYWNSFDDKISASNSHLSRSYIFDFSIIRENIAKLGPLLNHYILNLNFTVERLSTASSTNNNVLENAYVLPEFILCCLGSRFPVSTAPLQLLSTQKYSETFNTFLIRIFIAHELLAKLVKKQYFGIKYTFEYCPGLHNLSTFELFVLAYQKEEKQVYAIYPEYLIVDTVILLETCDFLEEFAKHGIKIIVPNIVFAEIIVLSTNVQKPELFRATAKKVKQIIIEAIAKRSDNIQIYDINGERKFRFEVDEIRGNFPQQSNYGYPPILNKFNCILKVYKIIEELYAIKKPQMYGFYSSNIKMTKVLLLSEEEEPSSDNSRRLGIPLINLTSFLEWLKNSTGSTIFKLDNEIFKRTYYENSNNNNNFESYFSVPSDTNHKDIIYDEYNLFQLFKNEISAAVDEKNEYKRLPIQAHQDTSAIGVQIYPVGVIPPHYISSHNGTWTEPGMRTTNQNSIYPRCLNSNTSTE